MKSFEDLKGKTLVKIEGEKEDDCITFTCSDGTVCRLMYHPDCCASCWIEDICGDLDDLIGEPLLVAEEVDSSEAGSLDGDDGSYTWVFYKLDTRKGGVTIRWYGSSNGYYSETATFGVLTEKGWDDCYN